MADILIKCGKGRGYHFNILKLALLLYSILHFLSPFTPEPMLGKLEKSCGISLGYSLVKEDKFVLQGLAKSLLLSLTQNGIVHHPYSKKTWGIGLLL
jgi:hypothetical protein